MHCTAMKTRLLSGFGVKFGDLLHPTRQHASPGLPLKGLVSHKMFYKREVTNYVADAYFVVCRMKPLITYSYIGRLHNSNDKVFGVCWVYDG